MKFKPLLALAIVAAICATSAHALNISYSDSKDRLLGVVDPGTPANEANEVGMITFLLTKTASATNSELGYNNGGTGTRNLGDNPADGQTETYFFEVSATTIIPSPAPLAVLAGFVSNSTNPGTAFQLTTGYSWLTAKYSNYTEIYYIGDLAVGTTIDLIDKSPRTDTGNGLSGWSLFNPTTSNPPTSVPDGGTTVALLGLSLIGLLGAARRFAKRP